MKIENRLQELRIQLPTSPRPLGAYVPSVRVGGLLLTSGVGPFAEGKLMFKGKVGRELSLDQGYEAARLCALNCLSIAKTELGDLDLVERVVRLTGYVNSAEGFVEQPKVLNGASELVVNVFGDKGQHVRSAIGVFQLPSDMAVELEMIFKVME